MGGMAFADDALNALGTLCTVGAPLPFADIDRLSRCPEPPVQSDHTEALELDEPKLCLVYRIDKSPIVRGGGRRSRPPVQAYYKTIQAVYYLDTHRQLSKTTKGIMNKARVPVLLVVAREDNMCAE